MANAKTVAMLLIHLKNIDEKNGEKFTLSNLKLQKLMYYCQGGHYRWDGQRLIDDNLFEAWEYGPVIRSVYHDYKIYGQNDINLKTDNFDLHLEPNERETIEVIWSQLRSYSAFDLVELTHKETPWIEARNSGAPYISEESIQEFFSVNKEVHS